MVSQMYSYKKKKKKQNKYQAQLNRGLGFSSPVQQKTNFQITHFFSFPKVSQQPNKKQNKQ